MITLSKRLQAIADLVKPCETVADVGCDHGFLSIRLIEEGKAVHVFATDLRPGPLKAAKEHIHAHNLNNCIETIQCDGLRGIHRADAIVIAGMGGKTMTDILSAEPGKAGEASQLVLQPQSETGAFRRDLVRAGYRITGEDMVEEDGKFYPILSACRGEMDLSEEEAEFGPLLLDAKHPVLQKYLLWRLEVLEGLHNELSGREGERSRLRILEIDGELALVRKALGRFGKGSAKPV